MSKISCPNCGAFLQIDDDMLGTTIACGGCAKEFVAAKPRPRYDYERDDWDRDDEERPRRSSRRRSSFDEDDYDDEYDEDVDDLRRRRRFRNREVAQSGYAIASLVCGIVALVTSILSFCIIGSFISIPCGVIAIILGVVGMKPGSQGLAISGIVTAVIGLAITIAILAYWGLMFAANPVPPPPPPPAPVRVAPNPPAQFRGGNRPGF